MLSVKQLEIPKEWYQKSYYCLGVKVAYDNSTSAKQIGLRYEILVPITDDYSEKVLVLVPKFEPLFETGIVVLQFKNLELIPYGTKGFNPDVIRLRGVAEDVELVETLE